MSDKNLTFSMGRRWLIFSTVFVIGILAAYNMFKAPPLFSVIIPELGFTDENVGWVMSMFGIIGVILAFPAGGILNKLGIKKSLIITAASLAIGSALGALATNAGMLLASRVVEGIGMGLISVVGPAAIATIIPRAKQGLAMGLWAVWFPAGTVFAFNTAPALSAAFGWRSVWWTAAALSLAALVFAIVCYAQPPAEKTGQETGTSTGVLRKPDMRSILLVAIGFMVWNMFNAGAIGGFYPTFLQSVYTMDPQSAGFVASLTNICVLALGPLSGIVSDKIGTRKGLLVFGFAGAAVFLTFGFGNSLTLIYVFLIGFSFFSASVATGTFSIIPELTHQPEKIGFSMAIVAFLQNIGIVVGSIVFPVLAASLAWDWNTASLLFCVPLAVVGLICAIFVREKANKE